MMRSSRKSGDLESFKVFKVFRYLTILVVDTHRYFIKRLL